MLDIKTLAHEDYMAGKSYAEIAQKYNLSVNTLKSWRRREGWNRKGDTRKDKRVQEKKKEVAPEIEIVTESEELTDNESLFCLFYSKTFNATSAYQKAYGCKRNAAATEGCRLLKKPKIAEVIEKMKRERYSRAFFSAEDIVQKYIDIAFADITDYVGFGTTKLQLQDKKTGKTTRKTINVVKLNESEEVDGTIISEISQGKDGTKIKLADRMKALDWLATHMNLASEEQKSEIITGVAMIPEVKGESE